MPTSRWPTSWKREIDAQAQFEREFETEGDDILESARARLPVRTTVNTLIYRGIPADEILGEAETGDYDLVVMGASGVVDLKHQILEVFRARWPGTRRVRCCWCDRGSTAYG